MQLVIIFLVVVGVLSLLLAGSIPVEVREDLPTDPIHWHTRLTVTVNGQDVPIPANVGIGTKKGEIQHTHDDDGVIHIHAPNLNPKYRTLGYFFDVWGVRLTNTCLFQYCNEQLEMFVNGEESEAFGDYVMNDKDEILLSVRTF